MRVPDESAAAHDIIAKLERRVFLSGYHSAFGVYLLDPASDARNATCNNVFIRGWLYFPGKSSGIDVYATARKNGFHIEVLKTRRQKPTYFGLPLVQ